MPHQCIRCGTVYEDAEVVLKGCPKCKSRFFYFFKEKPVEKPTILSESEIKEIEKDLADIWEESKDKPVILDMEAIKIPKPGKWEIDLVKLFKGGPVVFKIEDGKYVIDVASTFQLMKKEENAD